MPPRLALVAVAALLTVGSPALAAPRTHVVTIDRLAFGAMPAGVLRGDTIVWVNRDIFRHSATARDKSFDVDLPPRSRVTMRVGFVGSKAFYCKYHPGMKAVLTASGGKP